MMRSTVSHHGWSPQRLFATLKDSQAREKESWRHQLLSETVNKITEVGPTERDFAVTWMSQLNARFSFYPETFFLAVHTLDRFLTVVKSRPKYLKCIAVTCLYIASKLVEEEEHIPGTGELVEISECGCRPKDVLRMERIILTKLEWDLHTPTPLAYLEIFHSLAFSSQSKRPLSLNIKDGSPSEKSLFLARHLNQLTRELQHVICNYDLALFPSAAIALALVSLEIEDLMPDPNRWLMITSQIQACAKVKTNDLMSCRAVLLTFLPRKLRNPHINNPMYLVVANNNPRQKLNHTSVAKHKNAVDIIPLAYQGGAAKRKANDMNHLIPVLDYVKKIHTNNPIRDLDDAIAQVCEDTDEQTANNITEAHTLPNLAPESAISQGKRRVSHNNTVMKYDDATARDDINDAACPIQFQFQPDKVHHEPFVGNLLTDSGISEDSDWNSSSAQEEDDDDDGMDSDGYDSDKTLTASEGEDDEYTDRKKHEAMRMRPLTYAEIVKCGILETVAF